jgi:cold shock CspA family protein
MAESDDLMFYTEKSENSEEKKYTGIVKWFDNRNGFGFITVLRKPESNEKPSFLKNENNELADTDIFVHFSSLNVNHSQYKYLVLGEYVEFVVAKSENDKYKVCAKNVTGIQGGPLMCESKRLSTTPLLDPSLQPIPLRREPTSTGKRGRITAFRNAPRHEPLL